MRNAHAQGFKDSLAQHPLHSVRMTNFSIRATETLQKGLSTTKRLRGTDEQRITIQIVNLSQGGMNASGLEAVR
jgi:hypothetical protein